MLPVPDPRSPMSTPPLCSFTRSLILRIRFNNHQFQDSLQLRERSVINVLPRALPRLSLVDSTGTGGTPPSTPSAERTKEEGLAKYPQTMYKLLDQSARNEDTACHMRVRKRKQEVVHGRGLVIIFKRFVGSGRKKKLFPCGHCHICLPFSGKHQSHFFVLTAPGRLIVISHMQIALFLG